MTMINVNNKLYDEVKEFVKNSNKIEYPSINNFVMKAIQKQLAYEKLNKNE